MRRSNLVHHLFCATVLLLGPACSSDSGESAGDAESSDDTGGRGRPTPGEDAEDGTDADVADSSSDTAVGTDASTDAAAPDTVATDTTVPDTTIADTTVADTSTPDVTNDGCSAKLRFIYVIGKDKNLYQFDPDTGAFTLVGNVDCDEFLDTTPSSMAMSTLGVALVNYSDSSLQTVDIDDAACTESGWTSGTGGFSKFGMGYVADSIGGAETLYISNATTLASVNTATWAVTPIGALPSQSELTGTGNGELWGFFPLESPPQLLQLDRTNASVLNSYDLPPLPPNLDTFAFTAWGGEFYIFYRLSGLGESTTVYRFNRSTGALDQVVEDSGINVVGAGVSICAPTSR
jgi:hypothetical protein